MRAQRRQNIYYPHQEEELEVRDPVDQSDDILRHHRYEFERVPYPLEIKPGKYTGIAPRGYKRSDDKIRADICERMTLHGELDAGHVEVDVSGGIVTLKGGVHNRHSKRLAEAICDSVSGVIDVINQLEIPLPAKSRS